MEIKKVTHFFALKESKTIGQNLTTSLCSYGKKNIENYAQISNFN